MSSSNHHRHASPDKRQRCENFSHEHKILLANLVNSVDPNRLISSSARSSVIREKKLRLWDVIVANFNRTSGRKTTATKAQLQDLLRRVKDEARETFDKELTCLIKSPGKHDDVRPIMVGGHMLEDDNDMKYAFNLVPIEPPSPLVTGHGVDPIDMTSEGSPSMSNEYFPASMHEHSNEDDSHLDSSDVYVSTTPPHCKVPKIDYGVNGLLSNSHRKRQREMEIRMLEKLKQEEIKKSLELLDEKKKTEILQQELLKKKIAYVDAQAKVIENGNKVAISPEDLDTV